MVGGAGNDVYYVDSTGDTVTESANSGTDTVLSSITHTLGSNVENLTLTETSSINGTGNALDNNITGNSGNNTLNGGAGNDTYVFSNGGGTDVVTDSGADSSTQDIIRFQSDVLKESIAIFQGTSDLSIAYGSTDNITVTSQTSTNYGIEKVQLDNGLYMTATDINQLIQNMATFATAHNLAFSSVNDVKASPDLMAMVSSAWHS
jgi:Ca2+-binding RTX toxin-like protein